MTYKEVLVYKYTGAALCAILLTSLALHLCLTPGPEEGEGWDVSPHPTQRRLPVTLRHDLRHNPGKVTFMNWSSVHPDWSPGDYVTPSLYYSPGILLANNWNFSLLLGEGAACAPGKDGAILLVVAVVTKPEDYRDREFIRHSWGATLTSSPNVKVIFVTGPVLDALHFRHLASESRTFNDVIQYGYYDSYGHHGDRAVLGMLALRWFSTHCPLASFLHVTDADLVYDPRALVLSVSGEQGAGEGVYGRVVPPGPSPLPPAQLPLDSTPPHLSTAWFISGWAVPGLLDISNYVPLIHNTDIYITGILTTIAELKLKDLPEWKLENCLNRTLENSYINRTKDVDIVGCVAADYQDRAIVWKSFKIKS